MKRVKKPMSRSQKIVFSIAFILFVLYAIYVLFFFAFGFLISLKPLEVFKTDLSIRNPNLLSIPETLDFSAYKRAFSEWGYELDNGKYVGFFGMLWNSVWRTFGASFLSWFSSAMVCYILVHYSCKYTRMVYNLGLFVAMIPLYGAGAAQYKLYDTLHLINNPLILLTNITLFSTYFFYMYAFWKSISWSYAEAAMVDGANHYQIFFKIMFPMAAPSIIALFVMTFITGWNDYEGTLLYMKDYPNLPYGVYIFEELGGRKNDIPMFMSGVLLSLIPILILFLTFQNTIMEKVYLGGLKG